MFLTTGVLVLTLVQFLACGSAADFEAIKIETKLPAKLAGMRTLFDEVDSIYLLGGVNGSSETFSYEIFKYSITNETLEEVGRLPWVGNGNAVWLGNESIAYFGGASNSSWIYNSIWRTRTNDLCGRWSDVGDLPVGSVLHTSVWDQQENVYTFGGIDPTGEEVDIVSKYDVAKHSVETVGHVSIPLVAASSIWDNENGAAYIFGGDISRYTILKFDPADETVLLVATSPVQISLSCAIWTDKVAYVIGIGSIPSLLRFDPSTNQVTQIPVNNLPSRVDNSGCTFVKALNRMYIFGGYDYEQTERYSDSIVYIDLTESE